VRWRVLDVATFGVALVVAVVTDRLTTPDDVLPWTSGTLGAQSLAAAVMTSAGVLGPGRDAAAGRDPDPTWRFPFVVAMLPVAMPVVIAPTVLSGALDPDMSAVGNALTFVLAGVIAVLLGVLVVGLLLVPLGALVWVVVNAVRRRGGLGMLPVLLLMPAAIGMALGGALGQDVPGPGGRRQVVPILLGLLGVQEHEVVSAGWWWFGRACLAVVVLCVLLMLPWRRWLGLPGSSRAPR
jgi:hypothetical protein